MKPQVTIPLVCSIILHTVLFLLLVLNLSFASDPKVLPPQPQVIQASLVKMEEQAPKQASQTQAARQASPKPEREPDPVPPPRETKPTPAPPQEQRKAEEQKRQEEQKKVEEQRRLEQKKREEQKRVEAEKAKAAAAEQKKKAEEEARQKAEQERKRKAEEERKRAEAERQRKAEEERKRKAAEADRQRREELARAMAAEEQAMAAAKQGEAAASFKNVIAQLVQQSWSRPPSARTGMSVLLRIQMLRTGEIVNVAILRSSGNAEFDQSAVNAVRRVGSFPVPREMSEGVFRRDFATFQLDFNPQDLRL